MRPSRRPGTRSARSWRASSRRLRDCDFARVERGSIVKNVRGLKFERVRINGAIAPAPG
jgi:hypothetical protein